MLKKLSITYQEIKRKSPIALTTLYKKHLQKISNTGIIPISQRKKHAKKRALSSVGRASALQAEGHRFESCSAHHVEW